MFQLEKFHWKVYKHNSEIAWHWLRAFVNFYSSKVCFSLSMTNIFIILYYLMRMGMGMGKAKVCGGRRTIIRTLFNLMLPDTISSNLSF